MTIRIGPYRPRWWHVPLSIFWVFMVGSAAFIGGSSAYVLSRMLLFSNVTYNTYIFRVVEPAGGWTAPGLTYEGVPGAMLGVAQGAAVIAGLVMAFAGGRSWRLVGMSVVLAWGALWAVSAVNFAQEAHWTFGWLNAAVYSLPFLCAVLVFARRVFGRGGGGHGDADVPAPPISAPCA